MCVKLLTCRRPLLAVAKKRFAQKGWTNVHVIQQDATALQLPEARGGNRSLSLITLSYSLSMIPNFYGLVDRLERLLATDGIISAVYVA